MGFIPLYSSFSFSSGPAVLRNLTLVKSSVLARPANADAACTCDNTCTVGARFFNVMWKWSYVKWYDVMNYCKIAPWLDRSTRKLDRSIE